MEQAKAGKPKHDECSNRTSTPIGSDQCGDYSEEQPEHDHAPRNWAKVGSNLDQSEGRTRRRDLCDFGRSSSPNLSGNLSVEDCERLLNHLWRTLDLEDNLSSRRIEQQVVYVHERLHE